jgi:hypothetical protein
MAGKISGVAVAAAGGGAVFLFASLKGKSVLSSLQSLIRGQSPAGAAAAAPITGTSSSSSGGGGPPAENDQISISAAGSVSATANKALGKLMAAAYGWGTGQQWAYLESGWQEESGWSATAANVPSDPYNNAYGIPQANPGTKMASAGAGWKTSAATQIRWGLEYIQQTYGSPMQVPGWSATGPVAGYTGY